MPLSFTNENLRKFSPKPSFLRRTQENKPCRNTAILKRPWAQRGSRNKTTSPQRAVPLKGWVVDRFCPLLKTIFFSSGTSGNNDIQAVAADPAGV